MGNKNKVAFPHLRVGVGRPWSEPIPFGRYLLEKRLAVGGMSEVYLARPKTGNAPAPTLIIKRMLTGTLDDPQSRAAFDTEARVHAAAKHPNVVKAFETGEVNGEPYLAMEYVPGVDAFRLIRRAQTEKRLLPVPLSVFIARELCLALECVHRLHDDAGTPLHVVHRDVTPSNIYLSDTGEVKLGDFGIARSLARSTGGHALKGKYAYLAPEQVSGEECDHRADLFSLAVVLTEMLIGRALFSGAGQLAVLLAIRDCQVGPLHESAHLLPRGLVPVIEKGLSRVPSRRYASAEELSAALAPFAPDPPAALRLGLAEWVTWAADPGDLAKQVQGALHRTRRSRAAAEASPSASGTLADPSSLRQTLPEPHAIARVRTSDGRELSNVTFAKVVELIVTGELDGEDEVSIAHKPFRRIEDIELLARHLSPGGATTNRVDGPGVPDYAGELVVLGMVEVLSWVFTHRETGVLFADRKSGGSVPPGSPGSRNERRPSLAPIPTRKELYFDDGRLTVVASSEPSELFGEYLVRRGLIKRTELDVALAAMPRYEGRLGDTLIGLGFVDPVEVFRAIRSQARTRVADLFTWKAGRVGFYRGIKPQRIDFRIDLDIPELMLAGLEQPAVESVLRERFSAQRRAIFATVRPTPAHLLEVTWPPSIFDLAAAVESGRTLDDLLAVSQGRASDGDLPSLRALAVALATGLVRARHGE